MHLTSETGPKPVDTDFFCFDKSISATPSASKPSSVAQIFRSVVVGTRFGDGPQCVSSSFILLKLRIYQAIKVSYEIILVALSPDPL